MYIYIYQRYNQGNITIHTTKAIDINLYQVDLQQHEQRCRYSPFWRRWLNTNKSISKKLNCMKNDITSASSESNIVISDDYFILQSIQGNYDFVQGCTLMKCNQRVFYIISGGKTLYFEQQDCKLITSVYMAPFTPPPQKLSKGALKINQRCQLRYLQILTKSDNFMLCNLLLNQ